MSQGPISLLYVMALQISWEYTTKRENLRATGENARKSEGRRMRWQNLEAGACEVSAWHTKTKTYCNRAVWAFGDDGNTSGIDRLTKLLSLRLLEG